MKNLKVKSSVLAIILGLSAAFAFKAPVKKVQDNPYWQYVSGTITSPSSYTELSGSPTCSGNHNICAVAAPADPNSPGTPLFSTDLQTRISDKDTSDGDVFLKN